MRNKVELEYWLILVICIVFMCHIILKSENFWILKIHVIIKISYEELLCIGTVNSRYSSYVCLGNEFIGLDCLFLSYRWNSLFKKKSLKKQSFSWRIYMNYIPLPFLREIGRLVPKSRFECSVHIHQFCDLWQAM